MTKEIKRKAPFCRFEIEVKVVCDSKTYIKRREYSRGENNGCNHIDNIAGTAEYMGKEIYEEIMKGNLGQEKVKVIMKEIDLSFKKPDFKNTEKGVI